MNEATLQTYAKKIYGFALSKTKNDRDAEDLSQNILLELFRIPLDEATVGDMDAYVFRVCRYAWSNFYRHERKYWQMCTLDDILHAADEHPTPEDTVLENEEYRILRRSVLNLSHARRQVTVLYYFEGLSGAEIAQRLSMPQSTVRWHLSASKQHIKEQLEMENKLYTPKHLRVYFSGTANDFSLAGLRGDLIVQNIALACAREALTVEALCATIGVAAPYVEEKLPALLEMGYLKKVGGKLRTAFFIGDTAHTVAVAGFARKLLWSLAEAVYKVVAAHLDDIQKIGFLGNDLTDTALLWDFCTIAAHDYMNRNIHKNPHETPLRADGSRHYIRATVEETDILQACPDITPEVYDYIRYSGGPAGKHTSTDVVCMQQFDPPLITGGRNTFSPVIVEQITVAAHAAYHKALPAADAYEHALLTRALELGYAEIREGTVFMRCPVFTKPQYETFSAFFDETVLPEIEALCPPAIVDTYTDFVASRIPADLDPAEKAFAVNHFYFPNAVTYLLYKSDLLPLPEENERDAICTVLFER